MSGASNKAALRAPEQSNAQGGKLSENVRRPCREIPTIQQVQRELLKGEIKGVGGHEATVVPMQDLVPCNDTITQNLYYSCRTRVCVCVREREREARDACKRERERERRPGDAHR